MSLDYHVDFLPTSNTSRLKRTFLYHKKKMIFVIILAIYFYSNDSDEKGSFNSASNVTKQIQISQSVKKGAKNSAENNTSIIEPPVDKLTTNQDDVVKGVDKSGADVIQIKKTLYTSSAIEQVEEKATKNSDTSKATTPFPFIIPKATASEERAPTPLPIHKKPKLKSQTPIEEKPQNINDLYNEGLDDLLFNSDFLDELKYPK